MITPRNNDGVWSDVVSMVFSPLECVDAIRTYLCSRLMGAFSALDNER